MQINFKLLSNVLFSVFLIDILYISIKIKLP